MDWGTPLIFYKNICHGSESKGFKNSDYDDYMFTNGTIMVILWVGIDAIFVSSAGTSSPSGSLFGCCVQI